MTKTNTRNRIVSILLALVMLLSLLPTTALAATYPNSVTLYNGNGQIIGLSDKQYLATNDATVANNGYTNGSPYVARYDKSNGTLYLKGFQGVGENGGITAARDLNIVVESDSSFTTSRTTSNDTLMGIQASGKLDISGDGKLTVSANGKSAVYGIFAKEGVTISAPLDVTVKLTDSSNTSMYGIYTNSGAISLSGGAKTITVTGGGSAVYGVYNNVFTPEITDNGNIDISGKLTVNLINGRNNVGIYTGSGGAITLDDATVNIPGNFSLGICNNNGNVVINNGSDVTLTSDISNGKGVYARYGGDLIIENSAVKVSTNGYTADLEKGKLSIKDSTVDLTMNNNYYRVVETSNTAMNTIDLSGSGSVTLTALGKQTSAMIAGNVTATSGTKLEKGTHYPDLKTYDGEYDTVSDKTVLKFVHEDPAPATYTVSFNANGGTGTMADVTGISGEYTLPANGFTAPAGKQFKAWSVGGVEKAVGDKITVTANTTVTAVWENTPVVTYTVSFDANGGTGTMADVTGISGEYTLPANGFTAPAGKQFKAWSVGGVEKAVGDKITVTANTTVTAVWEAIEYNVTVTGGTASVGAGTPITKATMGTTVTLAAGAAPTGKVFDKWEVVSGGITLADVNSATTTFIMPASAVSVKATYKTTPVTTYKLTTQVNGGHGTISASKTGLTAGSTETITFNPEVGYEIDTVTVNGTATSVSGNTLNVTMNENKTVVVTYKAIEYNITVTDGKATVGAGTPITKATMGTAVTLTANAAPSGKVFDKWEVVSGGITLANANSATTTFTMPAEAVSVKATYKTAPHTHTYNQETVKPEALKTPADCTHNAVYFKSCSCGAISTTDTFKAMGTALGHAYGSDWKYDSTNHWHECSRCHDKPDIAAHSAGGWIVDTPATATTAGTKHKECTVCHRVLETQPIPSTGTATGGSHTHSYGTDWKYDDTNHWHECNCGDKKDKAAHSFKWVVDKEATETAEGAKHEECKTCGYKRPAVEIPATGSSHTNSSVYVGMTYTAGNLIYQITSIDTATVGQAKVIGVVAAKKDKITKVTIPNRADCNGYGLNVTAIGNNAFAGCKALKKLTIGNKVTVIGKNAFKKCSKLKTVVIGKAVKTISSKAFIGDNKIKKITFKGKKLKTVKKNAFSKKAKKNIKSKKTKLKGNKKAIKLFKKKLK